MKKSVYDYFISLEKQDLPRDKDGALIIDDDKIKALENASYNCPSVSINNIPYHKKSPLEINEIMELASARMYNNIGIATPIPYLFVDPKFKDRYISLVSQYLHAIEDLTFDEARTALNEEDYYKCQRLSKNKWDICKPEFKEIYLKHMTPECLEQLIGLFLVDELRTEKDRHSGNYFFYKPTTSSQYNGIVAIDHEKTQICDIKNSTPEDFDRFLEYECGALKPTGGLAFSSSHTYRINKIRDLIQKQIISPENIQLLKSALEYDFPQEIFESGKHPLLQPCQTKLYDGVSRLWEYNRQELSEELGL